MKSSSGIFATLKQAWQYWGEDKASIFGAALSYYTIFSIGPLLLLVISVVGLLFGKSNVQQQLMMYLSSSLGKQTALLIQNAISSASHPGSNIISFIIGIILLLLGAVGVFQQLQTALNIIWGVEAKKGRGLISTIRDYLSSFSFLGLVSFLLIVSFLATAIISAINTYFTHFLPFSGFIIEVINFIVSFVIIIILFALVYKILPDIEISWRRVWGGAILASLLFTIGKTVIGIYIARSSSVSAYGAASSLVAFLLWVYYISQMLLFGAEYIKAEARVHNIMIQPKSYAHRIRGLESMDGKISRYDKLAAQTIGILTAVLVRKIDKKYFHKHENVWKKLLGQF